MCINVTNNADYNYSADLKTKEKQPWTTTLNEIKKHGPCVESWTTLLNFLGKTKADDEPLRLLTILEANGVAEAIWALRAIKGHRKEKMLLAVKITERVLHIFEEKYSDDLGPRQLIEAVKKDAKGMMPKEEMQIYDDAADYEAARVAACAAHKGAYAAACVAAYEAHAADYEAAKAAAYAAERIAQGSILKEIVEVAL